jgi:hypothetical protein
MLSWPALLLGPLIALCDLSIALALVGPACENQSRSLLHAVSIVSVAVVAVMTLLAWWAWRDQLRAGPNGALGADAHALPAVTRADLDSAAHRPQFVALIGLVLGALSLLVCVALWLPIWLLSPCY